MSDSRDAALDLRAPDPYAWAGLGVDAGWNAVPDRASVYVSADFAYLTNPGFGIALSAGAGFLGRF